MQGIKKLEVLQRFDVRGEELFLVRVKALLEFGLPLRAVVLVLDDFKGLGLFLIGKAPLFWFLNRYGQRLWSGRWGRCWCRCWRGSLGSSGIAVADGIRIQAIVGVQAVEALQAILAGVGDAAA